MTWLARVMMPEGLTSRWTSTQLVAASGPGAGPAGAEPELLRADGHVPRRRDDPVDLDRLRPLHGLGPKRSLCRRQLMSNSLPSGSFIPTA